MTVVLSMNPLCTPHHRLCGADEVLNSPDLTFNFVTSPPRAETPVPTPVEDTTTQPEDVKNVSSISDKPVGGESVAIDLDSSECRGLKRKCPLDSCENISEIVPSKRISPFLNTPKQRKDERRKVLRISIQKLRQMEDPEHFLRRSVLINNTVRRMQSEIREEKRTTSVSKGYPFYKRKNGYDYEVVNNSYLSSAAFCEEHIQVADGNMGDEVTDALVQSLETGNFSSSETPLENFTTDSQREKQIYSDMDTVFNNLIRALGET
ncbi:SERTA domain-containing protein 4-like [Haliotis rufescens]|uniref:SERTA domain-containing protein 4-like n=1 Tax=Haliotis rufescens TaxID=6454 RepID=UPI00201F8113|nr:SERTA domain-containing protein 4-like [Haliotis rufescens]